MDDALRNRLWNVLSTHCWRLPRRSDELSITPDLRDICYGLWHDHFKKPVDTIPYSCVQAVDLLRKGYFSCSWGEAYDFLEFVVTHASYAYIRKELIAESNHVLEQELSGYRFIAGKLTPVTTKEEISAIERAIAETATAFPHSTTHLRQAIALLAQRPKADYRNSIKESISSVESLCAAITGNQKATLGEALKAIDPEAELHGALRGAFEKLYGYTSDANGIRHALMDEEHLEQEDAVFMLVACSAFISYVIAKRARKQ